MVDMSAIGGLAASLQAAGDITKAMIGLRDASLLQGKVIELQGVILSAQQSALAAQSDQFALLERVRHLEAKVAELETWEREKQRYHLTELRSGVTAYALKAGMENGEPPHSICAACYERGKKSILQTQLWQPNRCTVLVCHECSSAFYTAGQPHPEHKGLRPTLTR